MADVEHHMAPRIGFLAIVGFIELAMAPVCRDQGVRSPPSDAPPEGGHESQSAPAKVLEPEEQNLDTFLARMSRARGNRHPCLDSENPQENLITPDTRDQINLVLAYLQGEDLLPPKWHLCATERFDGSWAVICRPLPPYINSEITVIVRAGAVEGRFYSEYIDYFPEDDDRFP